MKTQNYSIKNAKTRTFFHLLITAFLFLLTEIVHAQNPGVCISTNNSQADNSAMLDIVSNSKGILIPRLTQSDRNLIPSPAFGLMIFNTTTSCLNIWMGATWKQV